ncbi:hypothetical protein D918_04912 [Trichuris suis]|nr:hypothetical protein D918_04912 [Trichuris suis]
MVTRSWKPFLQQLSPFVNSRAQTLPRVGFTSDQASCYQGGSDKFARADQCTPTRSERLGEGGKVKPSLGRAINAAITCRAC